MNPLIKNYFLDIYFIYRLILGIAITTFSYIPLSAQPLIAVGNYFGNGVDGREITEVGFTPDMVMIKGNTNTDAVIKTNTMSETLSKRVTVNVSADHIGITGITPGGFRISNTNTVNGNGTDYYWVAVRNASGKIATGSYTGNNTDDRNITGIGFRPDYLMLFPESAHNASMKFPLPASDYTLPFHGNNSGIANAIQSFHDDGFQIGTHTSVNTNNTVYHYVAFKVDSTNIIVGNYTGNNSDDRLIETPITPTYLLIRSNANTFPFQKLATLCGDAAFNFHNQDAYVNTIQAFGLNGFQVGNNNSVNQNNRQYYYFALRGDITGEDCFGLPVELVSFKGKPKDNNVKLLWSTASETNNKYFEILRSDNGLTWFPIGRVNGQGNSQQLQNYVWIDESPLKGRNYYKIRQVDFSSEYSYTKIIKVDFSQDIYNIQVFPNPTTRYINIENINKPTNIRMIDTNGMVLFDKLITTNQMNLDMTSFVNGAYFLNFHDGYSSSNVTILKR